MSHFSSGPLSFLSPRRSGLVHINPGGRGAEVSSDLSNQTVDMVFVEVERTKTAVNTLVPLKISQVLELACQKC